MHFHQAATAVVGQGTKPSHISLLPRPLSSAEGSPGQGLACLPGGGRGGSWIPTLWVCWCDPLAALPAGAGFAVLISGSPVGPTWSLPYLQSYLPGFREYKQLLTTRVTNMVFSSFPLGLSVPYFIRCGLKRLLCIAWGDDR